MNQKHFTNVMDTSMDAVYDFFSRICHDEYMFEQLSMLSDIRSAAGYKTRKQALVRLLNANGLDCTIDTDVEALMELAKNLPATSEVEKWMLECFYQLYQAVPTCEAYMDRLVDALADDQAKSDSTRAAIVRQFVLHTSYQRSNLLKYLKKRFPELKNCRESQVSQYLDYIDEALFIAYEEDLSNKVTKPVELLQIASQLYQGYFQSAGKPRSRLYQFAIVFNMKAYPRSHPLYASMESLEKNLFFDYYADNMKRYISKGYASDSARQEQEPSALGINCKNFAELIYVYYLGRDDLSIDEKLHQALDLIQKCMKDLSVQYEALDEEAKADLEDDMMTRYWESDILDVSLETMNEQELYDYILEQFPLQEARSKTKDVTTINAQTNTARRFLERMPLHNRYSSLIRQRETRGAPVKDPTKKTLRMKGIQHPIMESLLSENGLLDKTGLLDVLEAHRDELPELAADQDFVAILEKMNQIMDVRTLDARNVTGPISRTTAITKLFYNYLIVEENKDRVSFQSLCENLIDFLDGFLEKCRYQPISTKNLYDLYLLFSAYRYICLY